MSGLDCNRGIKEYRLWTIPGGDMSQCDITGPSIMHSLIMDLITAQYRGLYTMWHGYLMLRFLCVATKNCVDTGHAAACAGQMVTQVVGLIDQSAIRSAYKTDLAMTAGYVHVIQLNQLTSIESHCSPCMISMFIWFPEKSASLKGYVTTPISSLFINVWRWNTLNISVISSNDRRRPNLHTTLYTGLRILGMTSVLCTSPLFGRRWTMTNELHGPSSELFWDRLVALWMWTVSVWHCISLCRENCSIGGPTSAPWDS